MGGIRHGLTTGAKTYHAHRHTDACHGNGADEFDIVDLGEWRVSQHVAQHRALDRHQRIDRHALGMPFQRSERVDEADAILARFAHADDPAAAHVDPRIAHIL